MVLCLSVSKEGWIPNTPIDWAKARLFIYHPTNVLTGTRSNVGRSRDSHAQDRVLSSWSLHVSMADRL